MCARTHACVQKRTERHQSDTESDKSDGESDKSDTESDKSDAVGELEGRSRQLRVTLLVMPVALRAALETRGTLVAKASLPDTERNDASQQTAAVWAEWFCSSAEAHDGSQTLQYSFR